MSEAILKGGMAVHCDFFEKSSRPSGLFKASVGECSILRKKGHFHEEKKKPIFAIEKNPRPLNAIIWKDRKHSNRNFAGKPNVPFARFLNLKNKIRPPGKRAM
jgi:hypothetical protein